MKYFYNLHLVDISLAVLTTSAKQIALNLHQQIFFSQFQQNQLLLLQQIYFSRHLFLPLQQICLFVREQYLRQQTFLLQSQLILFIVHFSASTSVDIFFTVLTASAGSVLEISTSVDIFSLRSYSQCSVLRLHSSVPADIFVFIFIYNLPQQTFSLRYFLSVITDYAEIAPNNLPQQAFLYNLNIYPPPSRHSLCSFN